MRNIFKKSETEEQLIVRWADSLILNSDSKGIVSKKSLRHDAYSSDKLPTEQEKAEWAKNTSRIIRDKALKKYDGTNTNYGVIIHELNRLSTAVKKFLFDNDYIINPSDHEDFLTLTDTGKEVKKHKGHKKYLKFKERELAATIGDHNSKRYYIPLIIAGVGVLFSTGISLGTCYYNSTKDKNEKDTIDTLQLQQHRTELMLQNLESQVDSISNLLLSKQKDTTEKKQQVIKSTKLSDNTNK